MASAKVFNLAKIFGNYFVLFPTSTSLEKEKETFKYERKSQ